MHLGVLIKNYRSQHKLSQDDIADKTGLSKAYISMLERNENSRDKQPIVPSLETIKAVADAIEMDLNDVLNILDPGTQVNIAKTLDDQTQRTIFSMSKLNVSGKQKVAEYANDLVETGKYRIQENIVEYPALDEMKFAADSGCEISDEDKQQFQENILKHIKKETKSDKKK